MKDASLPCAGTYDVRGDRHNLLRQLCPNHRERGVVRILLCDLCLGGRLSNSSRESASLSSL